jgi:small subunit ribosomal protein S8
MISDQIADFLSRIRNAVKAQHRFVDADWSKMRENIAKILKEYGFIENYLIKKDSESRGKIRIFLKYGSSRYSVIQGIRRMSKPGCRQYICHNDIPHFYGGQGLSIISTSQGVIAGKEAEKRKIGGELLCLIW